MRRRSLLSAVAAALTVTLCFATLVCCDGAPFDASTLSVDDADFSLFTWNVFLGNGSGNDSIDVIDSYNPDVIHFQEALGFYDKLVVPFLAEHTDYSVLNTTVGGGVVGSTPIVYKTEKFEVLSNGVECLTDAHLGNGSKTISWAVFKIKSSGKMYFDVNFHGAVSRAFYPEMAGMTPNEVVEAGDEWRLKNVKQLLSKIDALNADFGACKTVIAGDCNFDCYSDAFDTLIKAKFFDAQTAALLSRSEDSLFLKSTHTLGVNNAAEGPTIDHIFGSDGVYFLTHKIDRSEKTIGASDHFPSFATIYLQV